MIVARDGLHGLEPLQPTGFAKPGSDRPGAGIQLIPYKMSRFNMAIQQDILDYMATVFPAQEMPSLISRLESATTSERIQRCIVFASRGHPWYFDYLSRLAQIDWRDVIMAGEYERFGERLYDFSKPIPEARIEVDRYPSPDVLRKK